MIDQKQLLNWAIQGLEGVTNNLDRWYKEGICVDDEQRDRIENLIDTLAFMIYGKTCLPRKTKTGSNVVANEDSIPRPDQEAIGK